MTLDVGEAFICADLNGTHTVAPTYALGDMGGTLFMALGFGEERGTEARGRDER